MLLMEDNAVFRQEVVAMLYEIIQKSAVCEPAVRAHVLPPAWQSSFHLLCGRYTIRITMRYEWNEEAAAIAKSTASLSRPP